MLAPAIGTTWRDHGQGVQGGSSGWTCATRCPTGRRSLPEARARGGPQRPVRPVRRHRPGRLVPVRGAHRDAHPAAPGGPRAALLPVAHHRGVLALAVLLPHRPQPPPHRLRHRLGGLQRVPRLPRPHPRSYATWAPSCATAGGAPSGWARTTTCRSTPSPWAPRGRVAPAARLQSLLRVHRRRDQPVVPDLVEDNRFVNQASRRSRAITCPGISPTRPSA